MKMKIDRESVVFENQAFVYFLKDGKVFRGSRGRRSLELGMRINAKVFLKKEGIKEIESMVIGNIKDIKRAKALVKFGVTIKYAYGYLKYRLVIEGNAEFV